MRISDWSSDVCSSDLDGKRRQESLHRTGAAKFEGVEKGTGKELHRAMPLDQFSGAIDGFQSPEYFGPRDRHGEALPIQRLDLRQRVHTVGARFDENAARPCERPEMALQLAQRIEGFVTGPVLGATRNAAQQLVERSEDPTSELPSLMRNSY